MAIENWGVYERDTGWSNYAINYGLPQIQLLNAAGLNICAINVDHDAWDRNLIVAGEFTSGLPYRDHIKYLIDQGKLLNVRHILWPSLEYNATPANKIGLFLTPSRLQDHIAWVKEMIAYCDPYAVMPMDEIAGQKNVSGYGTDLPQITQAEYRAAMTTFIEGVRAVYPYIRVYVQAAPCTGYGLGECFQDNYLPFDNVVYNAGGYPYYSGAGDGWRALYNTAATQAELDVARDALYTAFYRKAGNVLYDRPVQFIPAIVNPYSGGIFSPPNNWGACMQDTYDFCIAHNLECIQFDMRGLNKEYAILTTNQLNWNPVGRLFVQNNPLTPNPPECLIDADCGEGYICYYGTCVPIPPPDDVVRKVVGIGAPLTIALICALLASI